MSEEMQALGRTTISPAVIVAIIRMAALSVPGVSGMAAVSEGVRLFRRPEDQGVRILIQDNLVSGDIHLVLKEDVNLRDVSREVQMQVSRAIREMVGMEVSRIDIHVEDISYEAAKA